VGFEQFSIFNRCPFRQIIKSETRKQAEVVGSTPTRSISSILANYGIELSLFWTVVGQKFQAMSLLDRKNFLTIYLTSLGLSHLFLYAVMPVRLSETYVNSPLYFY
jgi:hypothetical protein